MWRFAVVLALIGVFSLSSPASADYDCEEFRSHAEAQDYFEANGGSSFNNVDGLDRDGDGLACELGGGVSSDDSWATTDEEADQAYFDYLDGKANQYDAENTYDPYLSGDGAETSVSIFDLALLPFRYPIILLALLVLGLIGKVMGSDSNSR